MYTYIGDPVVLSLLFVPLHTCIYASVFGVRPTVASTSADSPVKAVEKSEKTEKSEKKKSFSSASNKKNNAEEAPTSTKTDSPPLPDDTRVAK